ncbi:hypothetical protein EV356DRAFT_519178 [Viridothelium virens]|uniref:Uncharacterized protein n=1 Tax=Viridothelium virens TaxID=1048519 RepID=A0A6A6GZ25_VIRVR|nr:hypothetical protein EV356DRAFT_519178 [Viridothelium virens]
MSAYFDAITSPLRGKAAPRSQSYLVNALSEQEISKGSSNMLQERITASGASNNLFYAYARRTEHPTGSRYILVFDTVETCDEWWKLIQREYPSQCQRTATQFFSFTGDAFPYKPSTNKKFEHLKSKWFYCQIGDASSTSGRGVDILPLQDGRGFPLAGANLQPVSAGTSVGKRLSMGRDSVADEDQEQEVYAYEEGLKRMEEALESTATQMCALAEGQKLGQEALQTFVDRQMAGEEHVSMLAERIETQSTLQERLLKTLEQSVEQVRKTGEKNVRFQDQIKGSIEQISHAQKQPPPQSPQSVANEQLLTSTLKKMQSSLDQNAVQMKAMTERHEESMKQMQTALRQNTAQMKALADSQAKAVTAFSEMLREHRASTVAAIQHHDIPSRPSTPKRAMSSTRSNASSTTETPPVPALPMDQFTFRSPPRKISTGKTLKTMKSQPNLNVQNHAGPGSEGERPRPPKLRQSLGTGEHARG